MLGKLIYFSGAVVLIIGLLQAVRAFQSQSKIDGILAAAIFAFGVIAFVGGIVKDQQDSRELLALQQSIDANRRDLASHHLTPPRVLASDQVASLTSLARRFPNTSVLVMSMADAESYNFGTQIAAALQQGGWHLEFTRDGTPETHGSQLGYNAKIPPLSVFSTEFPNIAKLVEDDFRKNGFSPTDRQIKEIPTSHNAVVIFVGDQLASIP